jgi:hypothetical protein
MEVYREPGSVGAGAAGLGLALGGGKKKAVTFAGVAASASLKKGKEAGSAGPRRALGDISNSRGTPHAGKGMGASASGKKPAFGARGKAGGLVLFVEPAGTGGVAAASEEEWEGEATCLRLAPPSPPPHGALNLCAMLDGARRRAPSRLGAARATLEADPTLLAEAAEDLSAAAADDFAADPLLLKGPALDGDLDLALCES